MSDKQTMMNNYRELYRRIKENGWFEYAPTRTMLELAASFTMMVAGFAVFILSNNLFMECASLLLATMGSLGVATNTHTASHYATFRSKAWNQAMVYFGYTFLFGASANYWWNKHVVVHHPNPNLIGVDNDADILPFFATTKESHDQASGWSRFYYGKIQWLVFPLAVAANTFAIGYAGWSFLLSRLRDPAKRRAKHWIDLGVLVLHWTAFVIVPLFFFPALEVIGFYVIRLVLMGYAMFLAFAPAHYPAEAAFCDTAHKDGDFILAQTATTINFRAGWLGRFLCSGVDYQIEHHLFPAVPHVYYKKMSKVVREFCEQHGYPYRSYSWGAAIWKSLKAMKTLKPTHPDLESFRQQPRQTESSS